MNLLECRNKINSIDDQICDLFVERMKVSSEVAKAKMAANMPVTDNSREREERLRMIKRAGDELGDRAAVLFTTLFDLSRSYQRYLISGNGQLAAALEAAGKADLESPFPDRAVVACQGVEGAYAQSACEKRNASNFKSKRSCAAHTQYASSGLPNNTTAIPIASR